MVDQHIERLQRMSNAMTFPEYFKQGGACSIKCTVEQLVATMTIIASAFFCAEG